MDIKNNNSTNNSQRVVNKSTEQDRTIPPLKDDNTLFKTPDKIEYYSKESNLPSPYDIKITDLSTGGGCGCKIEPAALHKMLEKIPRHLNHKNLLVGIENSDDAAVYKLTEDIALVFTNDFFTPMVDDPYTYGRIAAANALSDIYAMGGEPIMANAIVGMPTSKIPMSYMQSIMQGGVDVCHEAGIPLSGGHSIENPQPIYGLAVIGEINPNKIKTNSSSKPGDILMMTKPLGIGVISTGIQLGNLDPDANSDFMEAVTELNKAGAWLGKQEDVHAMTDITGFGLAGHLVEMAQGASVNIDIDSETVPYLKNVHEFIAKGMVPAGAYRNLEAYDSQLGFEGENWNVDAKLALTDPQSNGGLLFSVNPTAVSSIISGLVTAGFLAPTIIGKVKTATLEEKPVTFYKHTLTSGH